ncbi:MAG: nuclear transport factor 2 family protein [Gammaproteobacteria bacterium]|jgi:hypothetical protein|nr:nuclear transport factor 2 family protein [Gammaproteobacteria bacterium]MBP6053626.1 nuclear transport factor 2 family protein [Pseudomonadales bacterium]MBK6583330.1 nuclear transport factor 2 family protein [Gammaproteobacteria bacterium]MBK7170840.1 nuclear transport factor 2 family protein [Gammaproteobacteria bacterium]MBK7519477.1 nuclear transport factor 2 family protein [Gammaproteobacteria bacterium]
MKALNTFIIALILGCSSLAQADTASDQFEVMQLINRYTWGVDTLDKAVFEEVFLPDATAHYIGVGADAIDLDDRLEGIDAIYAWIVKGVGHRKGHDGLPWHFVSNHIVTLNGDQAKLTAYMHNRVLAAGGVYYVDAVKTPDGWRIKHLKLEEQTWNKDYYKNAPHKNVN